MSMAIVRPFPVKDCEKFVEGPPRLVNLASALPTVMALPREPLAVEVSKGYSRPTTSDPSVVTDRGLDPTAVDRGRLLYTFDAGRRGSSTIGSHGTGPSLSVTLSVPCHATGP